jgi:cytoskeleton protein RodZ
MKEAGEIGFGEELRRQRLVREVPLESIAAATKISVRYLEALERSDFSRLPAPVFTRGFIRAYATHLGLDPEEMVNAYLSETGVSGRQASSLPERGTGGSPRRPSPTFVAVGALAAALLLLIVLGLWRSVHRPAALSAPRAVSRLPVETPPHVQVVSETPRPPAPTASPGPAQTPGSPPNAIALSLDFGADCWIELFADDRLIYSGIIKEGETKHFEAEHAFRMTLGNAAAARISVNGRSLPPLGNPGEVVRDFRIDRSRLDSLLAPRG